MKEDKEFKKYMEESIRPYVVSWEEAAAYYGGWDEMERAMGIGKYDENYRKEN